MPLLHKDAAFNAVINTMEPFDVFRELSVLEPASAQHQRYRQGRGHGFENKRTII